SKSRDVIVFNNLLTVDSFSSSIEFILFLVLAHYFRVWFNPSIEITLLLSELSLPLLFLE
ncbi:MAG: hypothetical protein ACW99Q_22950, partial [Candidatus Kariarchaeaceae archaeon]